MDHFLEEYLTADIVTLIPFLAFLSIRQKLFILVSALFEASHIFCSYLMICYIISYDRGVKPYLTALSWIVAIFDVTKTILKK